MRQTILKVDWLAFVKSEPRAFLSDAAKAEAAVDWLVARAGHPADEKCAKTDML